MEVSWTCPVCSRKIVGSRQICLHEASLGLGNCATVPAAVPVITTPHLAPTQQNPVPTAIPIVIPDIEAPTVTAGIIVEEMFCRRSKHKPQQARVPRPSSRQLQNRSRDMVCVQDAWFHFVDNVAAQFSPDFWKFFCEIHDQSTSAIDAALRGVKKCFISQERGRQKMFASSKRQLFARISSKVCLL